MRTAYRLAVVGLVTLGCLLAGCATFCETDVPGPHDPFAHEQPPLSDRESYDQQGRRCVTVTIFDVIDGMAGTDELP